MSKKEIAFLKNLGVTIKKVTETAKEIALFARPDMGLRYQLMKRSSKKQVEFAKNEYKIAEAERDFIENKIVDIAKTRNPKYHLTKQKVHDMLEERDLVNWEIYRADKKTEAGKLRAQTLVKRITKINQELAKSMGFYDAAIITDITDKLGKINIPRIEEKAELVNTIVQIAKERNPERNLTKQEVEQKLIEQDKILSKMNEANEKAFSARQKAKKLTGQKKKEAENIAEQNVIQSKIWLNKSKGVNAFLATAMALPSGANIADKSGKINVKAIVIAAAGLAAAGGVAYYVMKNGVIPGDQSYVIDYENDETITIKKPDPIDIDPTKSYDENIDPSQIEQLKNNPSYIDALNNHSNSYNTQLNNLTNTAKQHVINDYNLIDAAGNNSGIDERQVFGSRLMGYNDIKRALNSDGEPSENIITMLVRGKEHYESELVTSTNNYENWFVNGMQGSEMQSALQVGGYEPNYENYQDLIQCIRGITSHQKANNITGEIETIYSYPESDKFSPDFLSQFAGKSLLMEPIDTDTQGTTLYNEMNNDQLSLNTFNDKINTYLEHATPQSRSQIESLIADIDLTQQQYAQDVQALNDAHLSELANLQNDFVSGNSNIASNALGDSIHSQALGSRSSNEPDVYASQQKTDFANVADGTFDQIGDTINSAMDAISSNPSALAAAITVAGVAVAGAGAVIVNKIKKSHNKNTPKSKETNSIVKRISNKIHKQKAPTKTIETKTNSNDKQMGL